MNISSKLIEKHMLVTIDAGVLDGVVAGPLERALRQVVKDHPKTPVVIDLSKVTHMTSQSIRAMFHSCPQSPRTTIRHASKHVWEQFSLAGMTGIFTFED